ncbi:MAG: metal-dependent transcriptional regulator [Lachnospirales bacterium]
MKDLTLSPSSENYVETLFFLKNENGDVRVTDLAIEVDVSKASVNKAVKNLKELELVNHNHYGSISLTDKGLNFAKEIARKHEILFNFLKLVGVDETTAEDEACTIEHFLSLDTVQKIEKYTKR